MIDAGYVLTMARYNAWQNRQLMRAFARLSPKAMRTDHGAYFGTILGTANHILWGDGMWMSRFAGVEKPPGGIADSVDLTASREDWELARFRMDSAMLLWAERLRSVDLAGEVRWYSGAMGRDMAKPVAHCVMHMFNHQTHHRGQIHAMLTTSGVEAPVTDLPFMPEDGPWL